jgi:hypothetical protein
MPWRNAVLAGHAIGSGRLRVREFYDRRASQEWLDALAPLGTDWRAASLIRLGLVRRGQRPRNRHRVGQRGPRQTSRQDNGSQLRGTGAPMKSVERKNFDTPDETRPFEGKGYAEMVIVAGKPVGRGTFEPGWRWSTNVKPIAKTDLCQVSHLGYIISGRMRIMMEDGSVEEFGPGDVFGAAPGHDAEVIGNEPCVNLDFGEIEAYAKRA